MSIDTLGYVKRLEAAGFKREQAEAQAEALRDEVVPQLATNARIESLEVSLKAHVETLIWKHTAAIILAVLAAVGLAIRLGS